MLSGFEPSGECGELFAEGVEGFFERCVAAVGLKSVEPFVRGVDAEEDKARE